MQRYISAIQENPSLLDLSEADRANALHITVSTLRRIENPTLYQKHTPEEFLKLQRQIKRYEKIIDASIDTPKNSVVSYPQNLDNCTYAVQSASEEETSMYNRPRVFMGYDSNGKPMYTRVSGKDQDERNDNIVKAFIKSGRIWEFMPNPMCQPSVPAEPPKELHPFTPYAQRWYKLYKGHLAPKTHETQKSWLKQLCSFFGDEPLESINVDRVQEFINTQQTFTTKVIKKKLTFMGEIFNRAMKNDRFITENPAKSDMLRLGGHEGKGIDALPRDVIRDLIDKIERSEDLNIKFWLALMLYVGLRREEMLGLRWEHIDFDKKVLHVKQAITYVSNGTNLGDTKNASSIRTIFMPDVLIEVLKPFARPSGYLVADENGVPFTDYTIGGLRDRVREYTNLPKLDARELRHSYATMLCEAGIDVKAIGTTMGHTKTSTTEGYIGKPGMDRLQSIRNAGIDYVLS